MLKSKSPISSLRLLSKFVIIESVHTAKYQSLQDTELIKGRIYTFTVVNRECKLTDYQKGSSLNFLDGFFANDHPRLPLTPANSPVTLGAVLRAIQLSSASVSLLAMPTSKRPA